ncbi:hypothetical protein UUU_26360 (plasmid) [Klebsiella pneumoniae subsp. pneumoniae DSM 30104 = JCM 1662 = NBRC 14940]|nr:hypothetical protein UUU_26360 [Klebsiella pneumoniae subsp. pneumoniae DSM 30104 = JCM 1662 = NBRC 14940]
MNKQRVFCAVKHNAKDSINNVSSAGNGLLNFMKREWLSLKRKRRAAVNKTKKISNPVILHSPQYVTANERSDKEMIHV